jgi:hypothetical protein
VAPRALRWVPRAGNGAVALVEAKETFLLDGRSAAVTRLGADAAREVAAAARRDSTVVVARNALVAADGTLRLWQGQRLVSLSAHGEPEQSARQYEWRLLAAGGSRAVAFDPYGRCFQSTDWGRSWLEVTAPPARIEERSDSTVGCSEVGCRLGPLLRLGWPTDLLAAEPAPELSTRPPRLPTDARPTLSCVSAGAPAFSRQPAPTEEDQERHVALGLGARRIVVGQGDDPGWIVRHGRALSHPYRGDDGDEALRAITYGLLGAWAVDDRTGATAPDAAAARALRRSAFIEPFDPSATIHEASLRLGELLETAARGRGARPSEGQPPETGGAIPVLGTTPGKLDGVLLTGPPGPVIWMMSSPRPRMLPLSLGPDVDYDAVIVSAVRTGAEELTVLVANSQGGATDVVALAPSGARRLWRLEARADCCGYPVNPDALGRAPDGSVVVIRTASGEEPASTLDPALALPAAGPEQALAAWSSLRVASDPACQQDPDGLRLVLQTTTRWIDLRSGGARVEAEGPMWATVRWGSARCCLEAVELAMDRVYLDEVERTTALVARFVPPLAEAARAGIHLGLEYRQAMRCELQSPP